MALDNYQQAHNLFGKSKNVLVIAGHTEIEDTYPASLGLASALKTIKKDVSVFTRGDIPEHFLFLGNDHHISKNIKSAQNIIVSIDISQKSIKQISYKKNNSHLTIHITPGGGAALEESDIHVKRDGFKYDLIVTLGIQDLESLHEDFSKNTSFFFETPIINIDRNSSNERYGEINIIELTSSSCSEILSNVLSAWDEDIIKKDTATCLLCGVIASTGNFKTRTTPATLFASANLMSKEADQQKIIKNIFKTKSFELLKIWGIAMSKLQFDASKKVGWVTLTQADFEESNSTPKSIPLVLGELRNNFSTSNIFVVFWENQTNYFGLINAPHKEQLELVSRDIEGQQKGNNLLFSLPSKDASLRKKVVVRIIRTLDRFGI